MIFAWIFLVVVEGFLSASCSNDLPDGFFEETIYSGFDSHVTGLDFFANDGMIVVALRDGRLFVLDPKQKPAEAKPFLTITNIWCVGELGLFDILLHPSKNIIYVYYNRLDPGNNIVSQFTYSGEGLNRTADLNSEFAVFTDTDGFLGPHHYGGSITFGPDGYLYLAMGDKTRSDLAQNDTYYAGKIVRFSELGDFPLDNYGMQDGANRKPGIWAKGVRNVFRTTWDLPTQRYALFEVGGNYQLTATEDIHLGVPAGNYGWPYCVGYCSSPFFTKCNCDSYKDALYSFMHNDSTLPTGYNAAIVGGFFYRGSHLPSSYNGTLFFGDYCRGFIKYLIFNDTDLKVASVNLFQGTGSKPWLINLKLSPDESIYYTTGDGFVGRIYYSKASSAPPSGSLEASASIGTSSSAITFTVNASDPENDSLTYTFNFGDGVVINSTNSSQVQHSFLNDGQFTVTAIIQDGINTVVLNPLTIKIGSIPKITLAAPMNNSYFMAGDTVLFAASSDQQVSYFWDIQFIHDNHLHPHHQFNTKNGSFLIELEGHSYSSTTGYKLTLRVNNTIGLTASTSVVIWPNKTNVTFTSNVLDGSFTLMIGELSVSQLPFQVDELRNFVQLISAPDSFCSKGLLYVFKSWSDGLPATHKFTFPNLPSSTLKVTYQKAGPCNIPEVRLPIKDSLALLLDADSGVDSESEKVLQWYDQSAWGNHLTSLSPSRAPILKNMTSQSNAVPHTIISFRGLGKGDVLVKKPFKYLPIGKSSRTIFFVVKYASKGFGGVVYGKGSCRRAFGLGISKAGTLYENDYCNKPSNYPLFFLNDNNGEWIIHSAVLLGSKLSHYRNGVLIQTVDYTLKPLNTQAGSIVMGSDFRTKAGAKMDVALIAIYDRALTEKERILTEEYLNRTYL